MEKHYLRNLEFKIYEAVPKNDFLYYTRTLESNPKFIGSGKKEAKKMHTFDYYLKQAEKTAKKIDWERVLKNKRCSIPLNIRQKHTVMFPYSQLSRKIGFI